MPVVWVVDDSPLDDRTTFDHGIGTNDRLAHDSPGTNDHPGRNHTALDACIRSTLHGAVTRGYDATLVTDAHTTEDLSSYGAPTPDMVIAHTNLYWQFHEAPGRTADTVTTAEVTFAPTT